MGMKPAKNCVDIGIVVHDIEKSLAFYEGLLGLEKVEELTLWLGTMHRMAFGESFVKLIDPHKSPPSGAVGLDSVVGFRYLTFQIDNLDDVLAECEQAGVPCELPRKELRPGVTIAMVRDPDGNVVEFVQRD